MPSALAGETPATQNKANLCLVVSMSYLVCSRRRSSTVTVRAGRPMMPVCRQGHFEKTKPISGQAKMELKTAMTKDYANDYRYTRRENKANFVPRPSSLVRRMEWLPGCTGSYAAISPVIIGFFSLFGAIFVC